ncbi:hypothetical protein BX666DRAFT_2023511 [Dichotomocladium elegans]|nr:hypothetical protein BX666DRAFT_2023511 [Dichotomocladium elegans]
MSRVDAPYICQSAANAIISEIGPHRVSNDALQAINQFLDEFLVFLLSSSLSLDLSCIKTAVFTLLPSTLGKNAIVEAELEVKAFTETEAVDYDSYERMRTLGTNGEPFPIKEALPLLREKCLEFCTLADREEHRVIPLLTNTYSISIVPIIAIYVTTVLEHIGEYVLTAIAMTAEHEDVEYIRIKEVFLALIDDVQVGSVFHQMELREKLEKRAFAYGYKPRTIHSQSFQGAPRQPPRTSSAQSTNVAEGDDFDISFDDLDLDYDDDNPDRFSVSMFSVKSAATQYRPTSLISGSTSNGTISTADSSSNSKKAFKVFKKDDSRDRPPISVSVYDPDAPTMDFEDLIRSGNTMKVSLTPNRLKSIEIKNQMIDDPASSKSWERRSTASASRVRMSDVPSRPGTPRAGSARAPPTPHTAPPGASPKPQSMPTKPKTAVITKINTFSADTKATPSPTLSMSPEPIDLKKIPPLPPINSRFENPRDAPKPPVLAEKCVMPISPPTSTPPPPSSSAIEVISKPTIEKRPEPSPPPVPAPVKKTEVKVLRRSSSSSKKSRENLRRQREKEIQEEEKRNASATTAIANPTAATATSITSDEPLVVVVEPAPGELHTVMSTSSIETATSAVASTTTSTTVNSSISSSGGGGGDSSDSSSNDIRPPTPVGGSNLSLKQEDKAVHFDPLTAQKDCPERPSSTVAKRASMIGSSRRQSLHESCAVNDIIRQRLSTAGSVEMSIKAWDEKMKKGEQERGPSPTVPAKRRTLLRRSSDDVKQSANQSPSDTAADAGIVAAPVAVNDPAIAVLSPATVGPARAERPASRVLDKVLQFERANSVDDSAQEYYRQQRASSYMPRRERFLYLQSEPGLLERRTASAIKPRPIMVDVEVQTDPITIVDEDDDEYDDDNEEQESAGPPALVITDEMGISVSKELEVDNFSERSSEHGMVDGDEEWFLQDDEWDDDQDQENAVVEWLLGEA